MDARMFTQLATAMTTTETVFAWIIAGLAAMTLIAIIAYALKKGKDEYEHRHM